MDTFSKSKRSKIMSLIRSKHTKPEILMRKMLRKAGICYRLHYGKEKVDIAMPSRKIALFVDGCFWHNCPKHGRLPKTNRGYWLRKLNRNIIRAKEKDKRLKLKGWRAMHIWEHELYSHKLPRLFLKRLCN